MPAQDIEVLLKYLNEAQLSFITQKTPKAYIKSDCLKRCASMLGIAGDVYWKELEIQAPENEPATLRQIPSSYSHKIS